MLKKSIKAICLALLCTAAFQACNSDSSSDSKPFYSPLDEWVDDDVTDPHIIESEIVEYDTAFAVTVKSSEFKYKDSTFTLPQRSSDKAIDVKLKVLPLYAFGTAATSGDYYAVQASVTAHNSLMYRHEVIHRSANNHYPSHFYGYYMGNLVVECQLLDSLGKPVSAEKVLFFSQPVPSTTIINTTYSKGFDFTLDASVTIGASKTKTKKDPVLSWRVTALGNVGVKFGWWNTTEQDIPDQTVQMHTSGDDRSVYYEFDSNNDKGGLGTDYIPAIFRTDQNVDLAWVWHVQSGSYCAKDNDFGNMKLRVRVIPQYRHSFSAIIEHYDAAVPTWRSFIMTPDVIACNSGTPDTLETVYDLPSINRIPIGAVSMMNTTWNYVTNIRIWREGEYSDGEEPYLKIFGSFDENETAKAIIREGCYDVLYDIVSGEGEPFGTFIIRNAEIKADRTLNISTLDGKRI